MNLEIDIRGIPFSDLYKQAAPPESQQTMEETTQEKVAKKFCSGKDIESDKFDEQCKQKWDSTAVTALLNVCQEQEKTNKYMDHKFWKHISENLAENGFPISAVQCKSKYENLKKQFKLQKLKAERSGEGQVKWEYFELMNNFMGSKPEIEPVATASSSGLFTSKSTKRLSSESENADSQDENRSPTVEKRQRNLGPKDKIPVASAILKLNEDANKRSEERLKRVDQALEQKNKALDIFQKMLDKL
ncbi:uncharacterized protein LOC136026605 isoform X2 [Artemia franciscana]